MRRRVILFLLIGAAGGAAARWLKLPGGAFVGAMLTTAFTSVIRPSTAPFPRWIRVAAGSLLGLTIGAGVNKETLTVLSRALFPIIFVVLSTMTSGLLSAWALIRAAGISPATALCGASPGALASMVALSDDLEGDPAAVASLHLVRLITVILVIPPFIYALFPQQPELPGQLVNTLRNPTELGPRALLLILGMAAAYGAVRLHIPAGELLAGMLVAAILTPTLQLNALPISWQLISQWLLGTSVGAGIQREDLTIFARIAKASALMTAFLLIWGLLTGWLLARLTFIDLPTALVGSAPGGAASMVALATELGADARLVVTMHTMRMVSLMALLPLLIRPLATHLGSTNSCGKDQGDERLAAPGS